MKAIVYFLMFFVISFQSQSQDVTIHKTQFNPGELNSDSFQASLSHAENVWAAIVPAERYTASTTVFDKCSPTNSSNVSDSDSHKIAGTYTTDFQEMTLRISGNHVTGTYKHKDGKIDGILKGNQLVGTWTQSNGRGKLVFVFSDDFSSFTGKWGYNESAPTSKWNGKKIGSSSSTSTTSSQQTTAPVSPKSDSDSHKIAGTYTTDFQEMTLRISGNHVTGTYKHKDGKVDGILQGNQLVGRWTQSNGRGKLVFVFSNDFSSFTGKWGYNESTPTSKWDGKKIGSSNTTSTTSSQQTTAPVSPKSDSDSHKIAGTYTTDFQEMTLRISGNHVTGTYKHKDGKVDGILQGNQLVGTWTQSNGRGKLVFVFSDDFSSFTGKWGYNESTPTSKWNGKKIGSSSTTESTGSVMSSVPVNIAGSWSTSGSKDHRGRIHFWQNGIDFIAIAAWPDESTGIWKSYKGEGQIEGRQMNFKVFPSSTNGTSADQGYVYHMTISEDNATITGYYTRNGKRTVDTNFNYKLVK